MRLRSLARTDLTVTNLCLDTSAFGHVVHPRTAFGLLDGFCARGGNFLQAGTGQGGTGFGRAEAIVSEWMRGRAVEREELVLAGRVVVPPRELGPGAITRFVDESFTGMIRSLRVDHIDLALCAMPDIRQPIAELLDALAQLVVSQRVRYIGLCGFDAWRMDHVVACGWFGPSASIAALQGVYSPFRREPFETSLAPACRSGDVAFLARRGLAPATGTDERTGRDPGHTRATEEAIEALARRRGESPEQTEIAWILGHPEVTSLVVRADWLHELLTSCAAAAEPLDPKECDEIVAADAVDFGAATVVVPRQGFMGLTGGWTPGD